MTSSVHIQPLPPRQLCAGPECPCPPWSGQLCIYSIRVNVYLVSTHGHGYILLGDLIVSDVPHVVSCQLQDVGRDVLQHGHHVDRHLVVHLVTKHLLTAHSIMGNVEHRASTADSCSGQMMKTGVPSAGGGSSRQVEPEGSSSSSSRWQPERQRSPTYQLGEENSSEHAPDRERGAQVKTRTKARAMRTDLVQDLV